MVSEEQFKDLSVKEKNSTGIYPVMSETTPRVAENSSCSSASVDVCGCVLGGGAAALACVLHKGEGGAVCNLHGRMPAGTVEAEPRCVREREKP